MKPEDKVPTLEQCRRLVELGVVLETAKSWTEDGYLLFSDLILRSDIKHIKRFPAPDVAELGEILSDFQVVKVHDNDHGKKFWAILDVDEWREMEWLTEEFDDKPEAQARCAALIWLIEHGYWKAKEVK